MSVSAQQTSFRDTIAAYFNEIKAATAESKNVWDFDLYAPILLVQPDTRRVYANFPNTAGALKEDGKIFTGTLPQSVNIANTATHWNGIDWAMVMLPLPDDRNDRLNLLAHELFHRAQPHLDIPLSNMSVSFDPRDIMPLEDKGTVYPNLRITDDWGILTVTKGALLSPAWDRVTVGIPTRIGEGKALGDGWILELKRGFVVQKEVASGNFVLKKK